MSLREELIAAREEIDRLRNALELSRERFADLAKIARETPWTGYDLAPSFLQSSADRIRWVLETDQIYNAMPHGYPDKVKP